MYNHFGTDTAMKRTGWRMEQEETENGTRRCKVHYVSARSEEPATIPRHSSQRIILSSGQYMVIYPIRPRCITVYLTEHNEQSEPAAIALNP
jgi:hypothetical protein